MPKKIAKEKIEDIKTQFLEYPDKSNKDIAKEFKISATKVDEMRREYNVHYDVEFMKATAGQFIKAYGEATQYWLAQISRLEAEKVELRKLLGEKKTIFKKLESGQSFPEEAPLDPRDKALIIEKIVNIEKQQSDIHSKILFQAGQGKAREVIKLMRSGKLSALIN